MKKFLLPLLFFLELSALGTVSGFYYLLIKGIEPVHWFIFTGGLSFDASLVICGQILFAVITCIAFRSKNKELLENITRGAWPLIPLFVLLFIPLNFFNISVFAGLVTFAAWRVFCRCDIPFPELQEQHRTTALLAVAGGLAGAAYGIWLQFHGVYHLSLIFSDWSVYVIAYKELASHWFSAPLKFLNAGGHFNLLPNLAGALLYTCTSEPFAIFVLNSLVIYSAVPCTYFAARSSGLAPLHALVFSLALLFHFTLANLNTCTFYGYHPNIYLLPLFLLFWGYFVQKKYWQAGIFLILSLLVQETFAVLWFGFGGVLLLFYPKKMRIAGVVLMGAMLLWFFLTTRVFMTWGNVENAAAYSQMFHYSNLGKTIPEILLSPIQKPEVFFRELLAVENFYFTFFLLLGFFAALFHAGLTVMLLPPLLGVFLLNNTELANVAMQYQVEFFVVLISASAMGLKSCGNHSAARLKGTLAAVVFAMVLCGFFVGRFPWGIYSGMSSEPESCRERIEKIKEIVPPGKKVQAALGYQAHLIGRNPLSDFLSRKIDTEAEYLILGMRDFFLNRNDIETLVRTIFESGAWKMAPIDPASEGVLVMIRVKP